MKITIQNYEEWMIDYIEGNLSHAQEMQLTEFLEYHPELKAELELFNQTKLQPDTHVVYAHKESLKKAESGRVITMMSWIKYSSAIAALFMLFIGVRYFTGTSNEPIAIKKYEYQNTDTQVAFDRTTDSMQQNISPNTKEKTNKIYYAQDQTPEKLQDKKEPNQKLKLTRDELNPISGIEYAQLEKIQSHANPQLDLKAIEDINLNTNNTNDLAIVNVKDSELKNISLNDNTNVIDWWKDAVAIGGGMEQVVTGILEYDFDPFQKKKGGEEVVKTTSIHFFGFNYYSRRKTSN